MKNYIYFFPIILLILIGCDYCPSKLRIRDSKGIRSRCASMEEKEELMSNPQTKKYIYQY